MKKLKKYLTFTDIISIVLLIAVDQGIKLIVDKNISLGEHIFNNGIFSITKIYNDGVSFGLLANKTFLIIIITIIALVLLVRLKEEANNALYNVAIILILSGAISNLMDRIIYQHVVDYIELNFINFAIFNVADILITFGFLAIITYEIIKSITDKK